MPIIKTFPLYRFLAECNSQWHPGLQCLYNTFQHAGLLFGNSEMHTLHICHTVGLSQTPWHLPSDHTAHETNSPPSAVLQIWQRHWWVTAGTEQCCHTGMKWRQELSIHVHCHVMLKEWIWRSNYRWWHSKSNTSVQQQNRFTWRNLHTILDKSASPILSATTMGEAGTSSLLVLIYQTTRHHIPEIFILQY